MSENILKKFMRVEKIYIKLPSQGKFYDEDIIKMTSSNEVGILPMTASDELALTTPDALLNGESIKQVVESCCPAVKDASKLFSPDIDAILLAIRFASIGDNLKFISNCPKCEHENNYETSIRNLLENVSFLKPPYIVKLDNLKVFIKPYTFETNSKIAMQALETRKLFKNINAENMEEMEQIIQYSNSFKKISEVNIDLVLDGIEKIEAIDDDNTKVIVEEPEFILEWLFDIEKNSIDKIRKQISEVNSIGVLKKIEIECSECQHKWQTQIEFNPTDFFE